jgi:hypothetical protein
MPLYVFEEDCVPDVRSLAEFSSERALEQSNQWRLQSAVGG